MIYTPFHLNTIHITIFIQGETGSPEFRRFPIGNLEKRVCMPKLIPALPVLGLFSLGLAGSNWWASEPARAAGQQAQTPERPQARPLFFREDWKLAPGLPNINTPQE